MSEPYYWKFDARKYRCAILPFFKARYLHHTNYYRYNDGEILWIDLLPVCGLSHWLLHAIAGGSLWMKDAVRRQNRMARQWNLEWLLSYPNPLQRCLHLWGRLYWPLKIVVIAYGAIWWL